MLAIAAALPRRLQHRPNLLRLLQAPGVEPSRCLVRTYAVHCGDCIAYCNINALATCTILYLDHASFQALTDDNDRGNANQFGIIKLDALRLWLLRLLTCQRPPDKRLRGLFHAATPSLYRRDAVQQSQLLLGRRLFHMNPW